MGGGSQNLCLELWPQMTPQAKFQPFEVCDMAHWQRLCLESITGSVKGAQVPPVFVCLTLEGECPFHIIFPRLIMFLQRSHTQFGPSIQLPTSILHVLDCSWKTQISSYLPHFLCPIFSLWEGFSISPPVYPVPASIALFLLLPTMAFTIQWTEQG